MSFIKNIFNKFKNALVTTAYFIGYSLINIVSGAALVAGIFGIFFTAGAIAKLAILETAYLAAETYILMRVGKRAGLKLLDFILEKSGMVESSRSRPDGEFLKIFKPSYKTADDESTFSSGLSLDTSWSFGPFSISLPWAGYSKKIPLEFKDLKNYVRMGINYLFSKSGLEARCNYIARTQDNVDIEMNLLIGAKGSKGDLEVIQSIKDNEKRKNIELVNTTIDRNSKITQQLKYNERVEIEQLNSDPIWSQVSKKMTTIANQIKYTQDAPRITEILSKAKEQRELRKQQEDAARVRVLRWNKKYKPHENTANERQSESTGGEILEVGTRMDYEPTTTKKTNKRL